MRSLVNLTNTESLKQVIANLKSSKPNRGDWVVGFGWDESRWKDSQRPSAAILDKLFPDNPVSLSRIDGHVLWVNSVALLRAGLSLDQKPPSFVGGRFETDGQGLMTGILVDSARSLIDTKIPTFSESEFKTFLKRGMDVFIENGLTHIRDVGGCFSHWELAQQMEKDNELALFCEMYFNLKKVSELSQRVAEITEARKAPSHQIRVSGLKIFFDGALGSEGAYLSHPYPSGKNGLVHFDVNEIEAILRGCWEKKIAVAVHTLGDEAVHQMVSLARRLYERKIVGELHLEHCEVVRPETIALMKGLDIRCHLQPSHFLSDFRWLRQKLNKLYKFCFPWCALIEAGIPINFGSDSPIENPSLRRTEQGIELASQNGILSPPSSPWLFHSHHDGSWGRNCFTNLHSDGTLSVHFNRD